MNDVNGLANLCTVSSVMQDLLQVRQCLSILVDEDVPHIQIDGFRSLGVDAETGLPDGIQHTQRRAKDFRTQPFERVETAPAKSINQRDAESLTPAGIERSLLEVPNQVANQHLMLRHTVRIDLCRSVPPIVVTLCQVQAFLRY